LIYAAESKFAISMCTFLAQSSMKTSNRTEPPLHLPVGALGIIDRYLLRQFLKTFFVCFISLMGLYVVFECTTNMDEFLRCGQKVGGVLQLMARRYSYQAFAFFDRTNSLLVLISAMFTVSWIQRHNELTALLSAGISRIRVVLPLIAVAAMISVLAIANRELLIPRFREQLSRRPQDLIGDQGQSLDPRYDNQTDVIIRGKFTYGENKRIEQPDFLMPPALMQYGKQVQADNAYYLAPQGKRPGGYLFDKVREPKHLDTRPSLLWAGRPVLITPHDAPDWLKSDQCFIVSNLDFEQLTSGKQFCSTAQLISGLNNPSLAYEADVRVAVHARMVQPFLDVTLLFLGLPLIVRRESRNVFLAIGLCMGVAVVFMLTIMGMQYLGTYSFIQPALAAWAPLMIFVPLAVWLSHSMWE
jgi:lipopolysaccharide export system permease protein